MPLIEFGVCQQTGGHLQAGQLPYEGKKSLIRGLLQDIVCGTYEILPNDVINLFHSQELISNCP